MKIEDEQIDYTDREEETYLKFNELTLNKLLAIAIVYGLIIKYIK